MSLSNYVSENAVAFLFIGMAKEILNLPQICIRRIMAKAAIKLSISISINKGFNFSISF